MAKPPTAIRTPKTQTKKEGKLAKEKTTNLLTSCPTHSRPLMRAARGCVAHGRRSRTARTFLCLPPKPWNAICVFGHGHGTSGCNRAPAATADRGVAAGRCRAARRGARATAVVTDRAARDASPKWAPCH